MIAIYIIGGIVCFLGGGLVGTILQERENNKKIKKLNGEKNQIPLAGGENLRIMKRDDGVVVVREDGHQDIELYDVDQLKPIQLIPMEKRILLTEEKD